MSLFLYWFKLNVIDEFEEVNGADDADYEYTSEEEDVKEVGVMSLEDQRREQQLRDDEAFARSLQEDDIPDGVEDVSVRK